LIALSLSLCVCDASALVRMRGETGVRVARRVDAAGVSSRGDRQSDRAVGGGAARRTERLRAATDRVFDEARCGETCVCLLRASVIDACCVCVCVWCGVCCLHGACACGVRACAGVRVTARRRNRRRVWRAGAARRHRRRAATAAATALSDPFAAGGLFCVRGVLLVCITRGGGGVVGDISCCVVACARACV
jgi:hypothetical protein